VEQAREQLATALNARPEEIVFTSGGSEANNHAIKGAARARKHRGRHIITSAVEHPAVEQVCTYLETQGFAVTTLDVDNTGRVDPRAVADAITPETILITIMHANNEVGTIQPIEEIAAIARQHDILMHSDGAQAVGKIKTDMQTLGVDLYSIAGHKFYGPKGIGALYVRSGVVLEKLIHGADHEHNWRAGTENVLEIVGLGAAAERVTQEGPRDSERLQRLRDQLQSTLTAAIPDAHVNGDPRHRLPNTLSISIPGLDANTLISELDDLAVSAGAACHSEGVDLSPVLTAMKVPESIAMGTLRLSPGRFTTPEEIETAASRIIDTVRRLRGDSHPEAIATDSSHIRLTRYTHGMGCACKLRPQVLESILGQMPALPDDHILVGNDTSDDAAVYRLDDTTALIQTVDFFTPVVDDPYTFGQIAAANALSDIYAMGGTPLLALNIVAFPAQRLPTTVLRDILNGAQDIAREAGIPVPGGHTIDDTEPKFGWAVTGRVHPDHIVCNSTARDGDDLVLTKPLGTGILSTALKRGVLTADVTERLTRTMTALNKSAAEAMQEIGVHACTDITGFGLLGHLYEMMRASKTSAVIHHDTIPFLPEVETWARAGLVPGGTRDNHSYTAAHVHYRPDLSELQQWLVNDAQTSGGLLIAVPADRTARLLQTLAERGVTDAVSIGRVGPEQTPMIRVE
jgi:selenium donor protein